MDLLTIYMYILVYFTYILVIVGSENKLINYGVALLTNSILSYMSFTITHEAVHGNIFKNKTLNDFVGITSSFLVSPLMTYDAFKAIHNWHHKYVNNKKLDPDFWISHSSWKMLLPKVVMQLPYYYYFLFFVYNGLQIKHLYQTIVTSIFVLILYTFDKTYLIKILFYYNFCPSFISVPVLSILFSFLTHRNLTEHTKTSHLYPFNGFLNILSILMCCQNYHAVHHNRPRLPFHKYKSHYELNRR